MVAAAAAMITAEAMMVAVISNRLGVIRFHEECFTMAFRLSMLSCCILDGIMQWQMEKVPGDTRLAYR